MNISRLAGLCILAFILSSAKVQAQNPEYIFLPELTYSWDQSDKLSFKSGISMFYSLSNADNAAAISYLEAALVGDYQYSEELKIGGGYKYRLVTPSLDGYQYEHRFLEQIGFSTMAGERKLSHRIRLEQRFRSSNYLNRLRYRLSHKLALEAGQGDPYLKISEEFMYAFNKDGKSGENRLFLGYGKTMKEGRDLEFGVQYRAGKLFTGTEILHRLLAKITVGFSK